LNTIRSYIFLSVLLAVFSASCNPETESGSIPSLQESFAKNDKKPFGTYIAYQQLNVMFSQNTIKNKTLSFDKTWNSISDTSSLYVCFAPALFVNDEEVKAMLDYVYAGNNLFIAANYIDDALLKKISCEEVAGAGTYFNVLDSLRTTSTKSTDSTFSYFYKPFKNYIKYKDSEFTKVLGFNEDDKPNYILYFHGKGKLFLHCDPKAFSNYFLLKKENYRYMQDAFSYANNFPDHLYWDDYYRRLFSKRSSGSRDSNFSTFNVLMSHPPLAWAFWLFLLLLLLYILFGGKRRQRVIDKIKPNVNTTVAFTETIGLLYLQNKDNKNIAEKMAAYFNEHVRNSYFLNTSMVNEDFITTLSRKSGVDKERVESLYRAIYHAHNNLVVDDYQLLSLNEQIQNFYKKK